MKALFAINWHAVRLFRLADMLYRSGHETAAYAVSAINRVLTGVEIEPGAALGPGLVIMHGHGIVIDRKVRVGAACQIFQQVTLGVNNRSAKGSPVLGDRVTVFAGAKVLGRVTIGDDAIIGANSVVLSDVPSGAVAAGVPARIVRRSAEIIT